jgi:hypothetical protein
VLEERNAAKADAKGEQAEGGEDGRNAKQQ